MAAQSVYVSITGLRLKSALYTPLFAYHALRSMAQARAIAIYPRIATGKVFGLVAEKVPTWDEVPALWREHGRDV